MLMERQLALLQDPAFAASIPEEDRVKAQKRMWMLYESSADAVLSARPASVRRGTYASDSTSLASLPTLPEELDLSTSSSVSDLLSPTSQETIASARSPSSGKHRHASVDMDEDEDEDEYVDVDDANSAVDAVGAMDLSANPP
jgi:hypothetical protein